MKKAQTFLKGKLGTFVSHFFSGDTNMTSQSCFWPFRERGDSTLTFLVWMCVSKRLQVVYHIGSQPGVENLQCSEHLHIQTIPFVLFTKVFRSKSFAVNLTSNLKPSIQLNRPIIRMSKSKYGLLLTRVKLFWHLICLHHYFGVHDQFTMVGGLWGVLSWSRYKRRY